LVFIQGFQLELVGSRRGKLLLAVAFLRLGVFSFIRRNRRSGGRGLGLLFGAGRIFRKIIEADIFVGRGGIGGVGEICIGEIRVRKVRVGILRGRGLRGFLGGGIVLEKVFFLGFKGKCRKGAYQ
jgi:hypothetical protein